MEKKNLRLLVVVVFIFLASCAVKVLVFGLRPEYPKNLYRDKIVFVEVDSLQPTLRWESFQGLKT